MYKYENLITENSKNHNTESNKYKKGNILSGKKNSFFPTTQSSQNQNRIQNNEGDSTLRNFQNSIKSTHYDNNDLKITNRSNAINSLNEITKTNDMPKKEKNKTFNDLYKKTYIFNYKPKNKKFNVLRNSKDVPKYLSKDNKHNRDNSNDNKYSNDNILDFDMGDSNVYYLVTHTYNHRNRNDNNNFIYDNNNNNNNNNKLRNKINKQNNNDNNRYNPKQKISKISLPFCVYDNYSGYRRRYDDDDKNLLNFDMNDDLYNKSFDQNQLGSFTPNFLRPDDSNERFRKRDIIPEDLLDDDENENVENENDVDNELEKRNNMSVHIMRNNISLPRESRKRYIDQSNNNPRLNLTDFRKRNKGFGDTIDNDDDNDKDKGDKRKGVKSVPNKRNNSNERSSGNLIKLKKIEYLRDI